MKGLSGLASLPLAAGLLIFLWGCAGAPEKPDLRENSLHINLNNFSLYTKSGFDPADIVAVPDSADGSWKIRRPHEQNKPRIIKFLGMETPKRFFLSPFKEQEREYTMLIPFVLSSGQFKQIQGERSPQPGIFLAALGDNWEIFLNGHRVKSEIHLDETGRIRSHRTWRYVSAPVDRAFFVPGTNIVGFRIVGEPNATDTGLWYGAPYYIDRYEAIQKAHDEYVLLAFCAVYLFAGLYHFLHYLNRTRDRFNLYYCFFSVSLAVYLLMRGHTIYTLIPDSNITFRIEYASLFMLFPLLAAFLEHLSFEKVRKATLVMGGMSLFLGALQGIFSNLFRDDILYIWMVFQIFELVYLLVFDMALVFYRNVRAQRAAEGETSLRRILVNFFIKTPPGNIFIGAGFVAVTGGIDVVQSINTGYGIFRFASIGLVMFAITTTVILARRFGLLFRRVDEMNTLLEASNLNLEATVRQRTRELELQTEAAESASRAKSDFLARMSHEIRTPLNAILGLSEVELQNKLPESARLNLEKIYGSGSLLLEIVNDILDISKIENGNFELFPTGYEFASLINDTIQLNIIRIGSKPIEFKLEIDETIPSRLYGDEVRVKQILNNLLSNAIKYTEAGEVRFAAGWEQRGGNAWLNFTVQDTGRGIKKEDLKKLFSDYAQFDTAANRRIEGTGLGLSITKGLVDKMKGTITVESEYLRGSVFRVSLPQGILNERPVGGETVENLRSFRFIEDRNRSRGNTLVRTRMPYGKALVVDDLETNLDVMKGLLMPYGLRVDTALSGREAVELIRSGEVQYDVIFMDHMMPEMDGVEATRIIREELGTPYAQQATIIALTANAVAGSREMFLENGFDDFIPKPVDIKQLDMALNRWIRNKQSEETLREAESQAAEQDPAPGALPGIDPEGEWLLEHPVAGVDFSAALIRCGNSGAAYMGILKSFVAHTPLLLEKMDSRLEASSPDYAIEVHGLKGTCNVIGAEGTAALAQELEFAAKEGNFDPVRQKHGGLRTQALDLTERLGALLEDWESGRPGTEKEQRAGPDRELLARLSAAAAELKSNGVEEILGELEQYRYQEGQELIAWLREQAENFDYAAMRRRLEEFFDAP
jgi:signal transduction histidine kinase/DNA-binding NarL/FixJ family response regulator/HPt (histidine-containing phosphotransfer) domain-containing protein